jgi:microcystin-dependent protein
MPCDGRLLNIAGNTTFFSNLGTYYGGDGKTNFAIPDLRGRVVMGDDEAAASYIGADFGSNDVTLGLSDIPSHTHTLTSGNTAATGGTGNSATNYQPSLVLHWVMSLYGSFPDPNSGGIPFPMIAELRLIAGSRSTGLDEGQWVSSDGSLYPINENDSLFTVLGTTFGGDGQDTFAVPDFGATVAEESGGVTVQGSTTVLGDTIGAPTLNISIGQLASHKHSLLELQITDIQHFNDDSAQLTLTGTIGYTAQVEYSSDLSSWQNLGAVSFTSATMTFPDANSSHAQHRFYHAYFP